MSWKSTHGRSTLQVFQRGGRESAFSSVSELEHPCRIKTCLQRLDTLKANNTNNNILDECRALWGEPEQAVCQGLQLRMRSSYTRARVPLRTCRGVEVVVAFSKK